MLKTLCNFYQKMSTSRERLSEIKTFVFLDLEATGLPMFENNKTKITEICLTAVHADHLRLGVFPRVQNKLSLCFNPCKLVSSVAEKITGLSNTLLENSNTFSKHTVSSINNFLNHNPGPVCLVAHNGFQFDYPILRREIDKADAILQESALCVDTLIAFREIEQLKTNVKVNENTGIYNMEIIQKAVNTDQVDEACRNIPNASIPEHDKLLFSRKSQLTNETTPQKQTIKNSEVPPNPKKIKLVEARKNLNFSISYKLGDVFSRFTKKTPINSHRADGDVQMLIMCAATLGDTFVDWCKQNAKHFSDIPAMVPGRKIGT